VAHLQPRKNVIGRRCAFGTAWRRRSTASSTTTAFVGSIADHQPAAHRGRKVDPAQDFFGRAAFLTVSGQLNIEAYCLALTKVYTLRPTLPRQRTRAPAATSPSSA